MNKGVITSVAEALVICRQSFIAVAVFSFGINILMLTPLFYMVNVFDKAVATGSLPTLFSLVLVAIFLYVVLGLLEWARSRVLIRIGSRLDLLLAPRLYEICFRIRHDNTGSTPRSIQPLSDLNALRQFIAGPSVAVLFDLPWTPFFILLMFLFHPVLALVAIIGIVIVTLIALANQRSTTANLQDANNKAALISLDNQRNIRNVEAISAMGMLPPLSEKWRVAQDAMLRVQSTASWTASAYSASIKTLGLAMQSAAITTAAILAMAQEITPGVIIGAAMLLGKTIQPIQQAVSGWKGFVDARDQYQRLDRLLKDAPPPVNKMVLPDITGKISATNAEVCAPGSESPILKEISFTIEPGSTVMVIGPSAAGKSTLIKAILGLWPTSNGDIRIDGTEAHYFDPDKLGRQIGYLPQGIELFEGSIADNIARFSLPEPDSVILAAKDAGIHDLILSLPEGYDTVIGSRGVRLSPGQEQRVGLARAVYKRPTLLIMDEPNSNLDEAGEKALNQAIATMKRAGSTVVLVSHRRTAIPLADEIIVLERGRVRETISREMVLERSRAAQLAAKKSSAKKLSAAETDKSEPDHTGTTNE